VGEPPYAAHTVSTAQIRLLAASEETQPVAQHPDYPASVTWEDDSGSAMDAPGSESSAMMMGGVTIRGYPRGCLAKLMTISELAAGGSVG
jgi:hypothetical protein